MNRIRKSVVVLSLIAFCYQATFVQAQTMTNEKSVFDEVGTAIKPHYLENLARREHWFRTLKPDTSLEANLTLALMSDGEKTIVNLQDYTKSASAFDSTFNFMCQNAIADSQLPSGLVQANFKAFLNVKFMVNSSNLKDVKIDVSLGDREIEKIKTLPPFQMPDWDALRARVKANESQK